MNELSIPVWLKVAQYIHMHDIILNKRNKITIKDYREYNNYRSSYAHVYKVFQAFVQAKLLDKTKKNNKNYYTKIDYTFFDSASYICCNIIRPIKYKIDNGDDINE